MPSVEMAPLATAGSVASASIRICGLARRSTRRAKSAGVAIDYFSLMNAPVLQGRAFHTGDAQPEAQVVIVNQRFVAGSRSSSWLTPADGESSATPTLLMRPKRSRG